MAVGTGANLGDPLILAALDEIGQTGSEEPDVELLGSYAEKVCDGACVEAELQQMATQLGGTYTAGEGIGTGLMELKDGAQLDLSQPSLRTWALELVGVAYDLRHLQLPAHRRGQVLAVTLVGLQGVGEALGTSSQAAQVAAKATGMLLGQLTTGVEELYGGKALHQVALLAALPHDGPGAALQQWKATYRRQLQAASEESKPKSTSQSIERRSLFTNHALAYCVFLLLLYFSFGAIYCIATMKFKQDTLLYSREKVD